MLEIVFIRGSSTIAHSRVRCELRMSVVRRLRSCRGYPGLRPGWAAACQPPGARFHREERIKWGVFSCFLLAWLVQIVSDWKRKR